MIAEEPIEQVTGDTVVPRIGMHHQLGDREHVPRGCELLDIGRYTPDEPLPPGTVAVHRDPEHEAHQGLGLGDKQVESRVPGVGDQALLELLAVMELLSGLDAAALHVQVGKVLTLPLGLPAVEPPQDRLPPPRVRHLGPVRIGPGVHRPLPRGWRRSSFRRGGCMRTARLQLAA